VDARKCRPTRVLTELPHDLHAAAAREGLCDPRTPMLASPRPVAQPELLKEVIGVCSRRRSSDVVSRN
jgi:hypothetical protein